MLDAVRDEIQIMMEKQENNISDSSSDSKIKKSGTQSSVTKIEPQQ
jgi:hypothetical protein